MRSRFPKGWLTCRATFIMTSRLFSVAHVDSENTGGNSLYAPSVHKPVTSCRPARLQAGGDDVGHYVRQRMLIYLVFMTEPADQSLPVELRRNGFLGLGQRDDQRGQAEATAFPRGDAARSDGEVRPHHQRGELGRPVWRVAFGISSSCWRISPAWGLLGLITTSRITSSRCND